MKKRFRRIVVLFLILTLFVGVVPCQAQAFEFDWGSDTPYEQPVIVVDAAIPNLFVAVSKQGFHPSSGNYVRIQADILIDTYVDGNAVTLQILNSKGKCVYQKILRDQYGRYINLKWNGKPSKNNPAGLSASKYVKAGKYTAKLTISGENDYYRIKTATATRSFKVNYKAPAKTKGIAKAKKIPMYTGYADIDYMAEKLIKAAGVTGKMSDDKKVKKIYHYMTTHFKHNLDYKKRYYNPSEATLTAYMKSVEKKVLGGKIEIIYKYGDVSSEMKYRCGVCYDMATIFAILCNHVGIHAGVCEGLYLNRNGTKMGHSWSVAMVDGKKYYYDVDVEIKNYRKGQGDYYWYKKTKSKSKKTHKYYQEEKL